MNDADVNVSLKLADRPFRGIMILEMFNISLPSFPYFLWGFIPSKRHV